MNKRRAGLGPCSPHRPRLSGPDHVWALEWVCTLQGDIDPLIERIKYSPMVLVREVPELLITIVMVHGAKIFVL